jgi:CBS domain-containing protein
MTELVRRFLDEGLEALAVLDEHGNAIGIISQDELVAAFSRRNEAPSAEEIMRDGVPQVPPDVPLAAAAQIMRDMNVRVLYLMHHAGGIEYPAAVVSYWHLMRHMAAEDADDLRDLGILAEREPPLTTFLRRRQEALDRANRGRSSD